MKLIYNTAKMTTMMRINKIKCVRPPINKNPNVDSNQRTRRIIAIVRKRPGSKLIKKRITTR
jgi:hypothetical protein